MSNSGGGSWTDFTNVASVAANPMIALNSVVPIRQGAKYTAQQEEKKTQEIKALLDKNAPPPLPKMPNVQDPMKLARATEASRARRYGGTGSTILTGALGVPGAASTSRKTLLGQ